MLADDIFAVGSTSKAYTSATMLKVAEEGYLTLDDTLGQWLPEIASNIPNGESITIRQLLNGTGGIYDYANGNEQFDTDAFNDPLSDRTPEELVAYKDEIPDDITFVNPSLFWGNGSIFANVSDVAQFFDGLFGGELLQPESLEEMLTLINTGLGSNKKLIL